MSGGGPWPGAISQVGTRTIASHVIEGEPPDEQKTWWLACEHGRIDVQVEDGASWEVDLAIRCSHGCRYEVAPDGR